MDAVALELQKRHGSGRCFSTRFWELSEAFGSERCNQRTDMRLGG